MNQPEMFWAMDIFQVLDGSKVRHSTDGAIEPPPPQDNQKHHLNMY